MAQYTPPIFSHEGKLSVVETLDQATQALAAHRAWMKRRAQNSITPSPNLGGDLEPPAPKQATWAIQTAYSQAPPPLSAEAGRGESARSKKKLSKGSVVPSDGALGEEGEGEGDRTSQDILPQKAQLDHFYSSPAAEEPGKRGSSDNIEKTRPSKINGGGKTRGEEEGQARKQLPKKKKPKSDLTATTHSHYVNKADSPLSSPYAQSQLPPTSPLTSPYAQSQFPPTSANSGRKSSAGKRSTSRGRSKVTPSDTNNGHPSPPLNPVTVATPPGVFYGSEVGSKREGLESFSYPPAAINAWASTSSLDKYIESLPSEKSELEIENRPPANTAFQISAKGPAAPVLQNGTSGVDGHLGKIPDGEQILKAKTSLNSNSSAVHKGRVSGRETSLYQSITANSHTYQVPSPQSDQSNSSYGEQDLENQSHVNSLREASTATIVAVSPAPKEQRTSYAMQGQSKLNLAEADRKVYHFESAISSSDLASLTREGLVVRETDWSNRKAKVVNGSLHDAVPEIIMVNSTETYSHDDLNISPEPLSDKPAIMPEAAKSSISTLIPSPDHQFEEEVFLPEMHTPIINKEMIDGGKDVMATTSSKQILVKSREKSPNARFINQEQPKSDEATGTSDLPALQTRKKSTKAENTATKTFVEPLPANKSRGNKAKITDLSKEHTVAKSKSAASPWQHRGATPSVGGDSYRLPPPKSEDFSSLELARNPSSIPPPHPEKKMPPLEVRLSETAVAYSSGVTAVHSSTEARSKEDRMEGLQAINLPPLKNLELTEVYLDGTELVRNLPPLKLLSPLSPNMEDFPLMGKRARPPPSYEIHRPKGGMALAPPCPSYGVDQPPGDVGLRHPRVNISGVTSALNHGGHMTSASEPQNLSTVQDESMEDGKTESPSEPSTHNLDVREVERDEGRQQDVAAKWNKWSSTLIPKVSSSATAQHPSGWSKGRSHSVSEVGRRREEEGEESYDGHPASTPNSASLSSQSFSLIGLPQGPSQLHLAAKYGNLRQLQSMLLQGHLDMPDQEGRTPLMYCVQNQGVHLGCADALIRAGASINKQTSDGSTALHLAASIGAVSIIELLLLNGAKPDVQDFEGRRPLHWATMQKGTKTFTVLLKHSSMGVNCVDDAGMTVLMWAAYNNNPSVVSFLIDQGADTEEKDRDGYTAMHWAVHKENSHCLQLLLQPDMTYFKDHKGKTVMHMAAEKGAMAACEVILKLRPDAIHDTDKMGRTPLHYAAALSRVDVSALLLDYGADATHKDTTSRTPLHYARTKKLDYVVALLSCHGNAVADFTRVSRSTSLASILNRSISFGQLPLSAESADPSPSHVATTPTGSTHHLSHSVSSLAESALSIPQGTGSGEGEVNVGIGDYLGRFFAEDKESVKHYYFRLIEEEGVICWSRSRETSYKSPSKALVLQVTKGPSSTVKKIPKFSPDDLHCYTFCVLTGGGALDLFAYNEDAFRMWVNKLEGVATKNSSLLASPGSKGQSLAQFKNSSVYSRPSSSHSLASRTSVAPKDVRVSHDSHMTALGGVAGRGDSEKQTDSSIFIAPSQSQKLPGKQQTIFSEYAYSGDII